MRWLLAAVAAFATFSTGAGARPATPIDVMVVGSWHFSSPGLDINNPKVDDVLKPERQRELGALAAALAEYRPTKILVERLTRTPDLTDPGYREYTDAMLAKDRDERVQVAFRLARRLGHADVYAIDEQPGEGEPDYFPFGKLVEWAKANGAGDRLDALLARGAEQARRIEALQDETIPCALAEINRSEATARDQALYYELLSIGDTVAQPGADLNAMWYLRNAKIFAKLQTLASPGDRLLVLFGSGHNYWLRHFAGTVPGYRNVDPVPYLEKASAVLP